MISRVWHGWTRPEDADAYEALLRQEVLVEIGQRAIEGYCGADVLRRTTPEGLVEFVTILWFESLAAVQAFAGTPHERAVVPPAARRLLHHFDGRSTHYEVREQRRQAPPSPRGAEPAARLAPR